MIGWVLVTALLLTPVFAWLLQARAQEPFDNPQKLRGRRLLSGREVDDRRLDLLENERLEPTEKVEERKDKS